MIREMYEDAKDWWFGLDVRVRYSLCEKYRIRRFSNFKIKRVVIYMSEVNHV